MGKPTAEELLGLHSRLMAADFDFIEKELSGRLEERLNSPEVNEKIRAAEDAVAEFKKDPQISNDPRLKALGDTLPEIMETRMRAMTQAVAEQIKAEHPEYADHIKEIEGGEVSEGELAKAKERLEEYIKNDMTGDVNKIVAAEVESITADIHDVKSITRKQFQEQLDEEKANLAYHTNDAVNNNAQTCAQMYANPALRDVVKGPMLQTFDKNMGRGFAVAIIERTNEIIEQKNAEAPEGAEKIPTIDAAEVFGNNNPAVSAPTGGMTP